ncbi:flagellar motor switch protein FliG [Sphingomonas hengshuiensis]|uniref:Flagellar motor switch protein FliG n=1 Tax=Sphingomonas hengshuiensis TaxID=1609977 RepID=A0A7U4LGF1_9SPHN|nr:flagellar motor switch protein FliG [Sphingomonas hengshuiensis]AJP73509.1 flagellar motor switch protein FliG [Sphingomonas hengshuiensis]
MTMARHFTGTERAAVLMMLVGEEEAAAILQKLDPDEVRLLGKAMFEVADVTESEVETVLDDFVGKARERTSVDFDPAPRIEGMMTRALGADRAESVLARIMPPQASSGLELLAWFEPQEIAAMVEAEHPQIAAVLLVNLDPDIAAQVFDHLPEALQPQILRRVAKLGPVPPEAIETLKAMLSARAGASRKPRGRQLGGTREAAKILSGARKITEQRVMPKLAKIDRDVARAIEEAMFVFDNLLELDDKNLSTLIRNIDSDTLVKSLKGVEEAVRNRFLGCMSSRAADGIRDEIEARGPMKLADVLEAQKVMIAIARGLVKDGTLQMPGKGGDDDYV